MNGPALASRNKFPLFTEQEGAKCRTLMVNSGNDGELSDRSEASSRDWSLGHSKYPSPQVYPPNPDLRLFCCVRSGEGRFWSTVSETSNPPSCIHHCCLPSFLHHCCLPSFLHPSVLPSHLAASTTATFPSSCILHHYFLHQLLLFPLTSSLHLLQNGARKAG